VHNEKNVKKIHDAFLPDHERGDIAKRTKCATGIGGDHNIDAGQTDKFWTVCPHGKYNCTHQ
jgi:hypothetical protein